MVMRKQIHAVLILMLLTLPGTLSMAQQVFLNPNPTQVTDPGIFTLSIEVDAAVTDFRGYRLVFSYDETVMDFVSAEKGSLFTGFNSYWWRVFDVSPDSLHIECMIFGAGLSVSGPGSVLLLHFQTIAQGISPLNFTDCTLYDVNGAIMTNITAIAGSVNIAYVPWYTISGTISDSATATPLANIPVVASGTAGTKVTDATGNYQFSLPQGYAGTLTPQYAYHHFSPATLTFPNLQQDITGANFSAAPDKVMIQGTITDGTGTPIAETHLYMGETYGCIPVTDGNFSQSVFCGSSGILMPVKTGVIFNPEQRQWTDITQNLTAQNFTGTATSLTYPISGTITDVETGAGISNVTLAFSDGGGEAITDLTGFFTHSVPYAWSGTITPDIYTHLFTPRKQTFFNVREPKTQVNFTAIRAYHITGEIMDEAIHYPIAGMRIIFSNNGDTAISNASGAYDHKVAKGWAGNATPFLPGYAATPQTRSYTQVFADSEAQSYEAWAVNGSVEYTVSSGEQCIWGAVNTFNTCCAFGPVVVEPEGTAILMAGTYIILKPGFHAKTGAHFHTEITPIAPPIKVLAGPVDAPDETIAAAETGEITAYPNPFSHRLTFRLTRVKAHEVIDIALYNSEGHCVARHNGYAAHDGMLLLPLVTHTLPTGIYFYSCSYGTQRTTGKLIKTN
ncbi:MAG: T9SS type A sorting domain-containing protein [Bacteroidia bacterium]|nr:T9SS type A sorting domain-containing protein [Bacteroidia bacterium]